MTDKRIRHIHFFYGIGLSAMLILSGLCLMTACVGIYLSGDQPFSRESVAAAFAPIAVPVIATLALVIIGFLLDLFLPKAAKKAVPVAQYSMLLHRLQAKADLEQADEAAKSAIAAQRACRMRHKLITAALLVIGSIVFLVYALQKGSFHPSEINDSIIMATAVLLPCMAVPFGYGVFAAYRGRISMKREIELLKALPSKPAAAPASQTDRTVMVARSILLCAGAALLLYGLFSGGTADVLTKAINICTECVGLG